ncbi:MAG: MFS transporter [Gammaproteobacteria bacterium]|jgi:MFS family permease
MREKLGELSPLMLASFLVQASNAAITTMIAIVIAQQPGGEQSDVSLIAASYALGFMLGCFLAPAQAARVGLIRSYAGAAAVVTISIVGLELLEGTLLWAFMRFVMGASIAAVLAISDAWLNGNTPSDLRGRVIAAYSIVLGIGSLASQMVFLFVDAETGGFALMFAVLMNIAVVLVAFTSSQPPALEAAADKRSAVFAISSWTAGVAAFVSGFATVSIVSILPFYLTEHAVPGTLVAMSLATLYLGRLLFQWPVGSLSDRVDRRTVLVALSAVVAALMVIMIVIGAREGKAISGALGPLLQGVAFGGMFLLGGVIFPIYSVASALAFDRAEGRSLIDISKSLLVIYSIGSIAGPFLVMAVNKIIGDDALAYCVLAAAILVIGTGLLRKAAATAVEKPVATNVIIPESSVEMVEAAAALAEEEDAKD